MAKISALPLLEDISGDEQVPAVKDGHTGRATLLTLMAPYLSMAESLTGPTYPDPATGLAATAEGDAFAVDNGDGTVTIYLHEAGPVATPQRTLATTAALGSSEPGRGAALSRMEDGATVQHAVGVAAAFPALLATAGPLAVGSTIRTANGYIYEVLGPGADPFDENTEPAGYHFETVGGAKLRLKASDFVTPEMLGGDIHLAAAYAAVFKVTLMTGPIDYEIDKAFQPHDITWISDNTRITQTRLGTGGDDPLDSAIYPGSNLVHIGRTYVNMLDTGTPAAAYRAHVLIGRWQTGEGPSNLKFDELILQGGHHNMNGFSIAGNSNKIRVRKIDGGVSTKIGRLLMAHWGNFTDHYRVGDTYFHTADPDPTTHPHDIVVDEVVGDLELSTGDFCGLVTVSGGYDIHVGRVNGRVVNNGESSGDLVLFLAGDLGLAYATADEKAAGMWGLSVGSIKGECSNSAYRRLGRALYFDKDDTPQDPADYFAKIQDTVCSIDAYNNEGNNLYCCVDGLNGYGKTRIGTIRSRNFRSAASFSNYTQNVVVDHIEAIDCRNRAIQLVGAGDTVSEFPSNIVIGSLRVNGTGLSEATAGASSVGSIQKIVSLHIGTIIIDKLKEMPFGAGSLDIGNQVYGVTIGSIQQNWTAPSGQLVCVVNAATAGMFVDIGNIICPVALIPVSGGITSRVKGRNREYHWPGGNSVPAGITVRIGDLFVAASATNTQYFHHIVTTAGVTGSTAVVTGYLPGV